MAWNAGHRPGSKRIGWQQAETVPGAPIQRQKLFPNAPQFMGGQLGKFHRRAGH